jgi:hypothetical protein
MINIKNHFQRFGLEKSLMPAKNIIAIQYARRIYRTVVRRNPVVHGGRGVFFWNVCKHD